MDQPRQAYIVGAGIAGLAAAALLIRDCGWRGPQIHLLEEAPLPGGSLDGTGDPAHGYRIRGGRMLERHYTCTYDLFRSIPSLADPAHSVTREIFEFSARVPTSSKSRLVVDRQPQEAPPLGLGLRDHLDLQRLLLQTESGLGREPIDTQFQPTFFETNFWIMWSTMFAFQSWHSAVEFRRYLRRFMHLMPGFNRLEGILRTPLNQYDSLVRPLVNWLRAQGADLQTGTHVEQVAFDAGEPPALVTGLRARSASTLRDLVVRERDLVMVTLGSMTEHTLFGSMIEAPRVQARPAGGAWDLWRGIAARSPAFGRPDVFCGDVARSIWYSFTVTQTDPAFFEFMERFTGNAAGTGGLVSFRNSRWLLSVVLAHQPHFLGQPANARVFWGYALYADRPGDHVAKPIADCSGAEILQELAGHLPLDAAARRALDAANCIPCAMPYITSQFMPRAAGDRPAVTPKGARNFAFLGQFCEVPDDTVFTVEYSVRTAQHAVYGLLEPGRAVTPMYRGYRDPGVILRALRALLRNTP